MLIILAHILAGLVLLGVIAGLVSILKVIDWNAAWMMLLFSFTCITAVAFVAGGIWAVDTLLLFYGVDV